MSGPPRTALSAPKSKIITAHTPAVTPIAPVCKQLLIGHGGKLQNPPKPAAGPYVIRAETAMPDFPRIKREIAGDTVVDTVADTVVVDTVVAAPLYNALLGPIEKRIDDFWIDYVATPQGYLRFAVHRLYVFRAIDHAEIASTMRCTHGTAQLRNALARACFWYSKINASVACRVTSTTLYKYAQDLTILCYILQEDALFDHFLEFTIDFRKVSAKMFADFGYPDVGHANYILSLEDDLAAHRNGDHAHTISRSQLHFESTLIPLRDILARYPKRRCANYFKAIDGTQLRPY